MFLDKIDLKLFLKTDFSDLIRRRGKSLFFNDHVLEVEVAKDVVSAVVQSAGTPKLYEVILFLESGKVISSSCDCPYGDGCKHEVAVVYHLLNAKIEVEEIVGGLARRKNVLREKRNANQLQPLPSIPGYGPLKIVDKLKPTLRFGFDRWYAHHWFETDSEISSKIYERSSWGKGFESIGDVTIERLDKIVQIRCNICFATSTKLCEHQYLVLKDLLSSKPGMDWYQDKLDFEEIYEGTSEMHSISIENLREAFQLLIIGDHFSIKPKMEGVALQEEVKDVRELVRMHLKLDSHSLKDTLFASEQNQVYANAVCWHNSSYRYESPIFCLIRGKMDKQQTKLATHIKEVDYPEYFNTSQRTLYRRLLETQKAVMADYASSQLDLRKILIEEFAIVKDVFHYYLGGGPGMGRFDGDIRKKDLHQFFFSELSARLVFKAYSEREMLVFSANLSVGDQLLDVSSLVFFNDYIICDGEGNGYLWEVPQDVRALEFFRERPRILFYPNDRPQFFAFLEEVGKHYKIDIDLSFAEEVTIEKAKRKVFLKELDEYVVFEPVLEYRRMKFDALQPQLMRIKSNKVTSYNLSEQLRQGFLHDLESLHPAWSAQRVSQAYHLSGEELMKNYWFLDFFEQCEKMGIAVYGREKLKLYKYNINRAQVTSVVKSGIDWFDIDLNISFGDQVVKTKDWLEAIKNNSRYIKLGDGSIGILPDKWLARLQRLQKSATYNRNGLHVDKLKFNLVDQLFEGMDLDAEAKADIAIRKQKLQSFREDKNYEVPHGIKADLRHYQEEGFKWLKFLQDLGFGGCLADDMGLGKTLQAICILADFHSKNGNKTSLVIVPRTLLFNWAAELDKFYPSLAYMVHHGPARAKKLTDLASSSVVISTYDTITSDIEIFRNHIWAYSILDESQAIKNPQSKRYKAMRLLKATHKLVMTGTPIENSTFDLFAQMTFVNPGLLGSMASFKRDFVKPIEKEADVNASQLLQKMVHPFVLRRTKEQVAKDLPEKTESILFCEMGSEQRRQYDELKHQIRESLLKKVEKEGVAKSKFMILDGLLRLRQMCNAPLLVDASLQNEQTESIKIDTLIEQITNEISGHNALVFSQFTSMLTLIREKLEDLNIPYAYLDGSTRDRQRVVDTFQQNESYRVFLISIKAGNTGLNLVKADYVYIVDPWWNPAVEAQAIDRTHRIGQDKHIFAYKLICKDTIEEKILELQKKKKKLAADIIHTDTSIMKSLTKKGLMDLFN